MEQNNLIKAASIICKNFGFNDDITTALSDSESESYKKLHQFLSQQISLLIDRDFEYLMQVFYRIDLNEQSVKAVFADSSLPLADTLATMIIERQLQKIAIWQQYSPKK